MNRVLHHICPHCDISTTGYKENGFVTIAKLGKRLAGAIYQHESASMSG
jgi:hypothetical protein